jgi:xylan 1,4-beta-xylosidase
MAAKRSGFTAALTLALIFARSSFLLFGQSPGPHSPDGAQGRLKTPPMRVVSPHELSISFPARLPYGRQAEIASIALTADGVTLKPSQHVLYDVLIPDFVTDAEVDRASLVFDTDQRVVVKLNHLEASPARCAVCSELKLVKTAMQTVRSVSLATSAEVVVDLEADTQPTRVFGKTNASVKDNSTRHADPVLIVHTRNRIEKPTGYVMYERSGIELPTMHPLMTYQMRDTSIRPGGDGNYYMTGTTGGPDWWAVTSNVQLWKSVDLRNWTPVITQPRLQSVVWNIDTQGTWQKPTMLRDGQRFRPVWAPEIHYLKGTYWIPYCIPRLGTGLLKSTTGKPEGPYESVINPDKPLTTGIDASLFQDDDGTVYFLWGGNNIARMKDDMSGLAEEPHQIGPTHQPFVGFEGISLVKIRGRYYLSGADFIFGEYHCFTASSPTLTGPYSDRYVSVPHGGHNNFFQDQGGRWWSTFFGNDLQAPFREQPGIVPMKFDQAGRLKPDLGNRSK